MWFDVDKAGLAALLAARGKSFAVFELLQNAWDANASEVAIELRPIPSQPYATLSVADDSPEGWADLTQAFTLFSRSHRAAEPMKRGRFCLGEKLVLSLCRSAKIVTTGGSIVFDETGRQRRNECRARGTLFEGEIRMTRDELAEIEQAVAQLIPPVPTTFNGQALARPAALKTFDARLPTILADEEGNLRPTMRQTTVVAYAGETAGGSSDSGGGAVLELGIPICDADWPWRLNVLQKVPLSMDRTSVTDAFRRALQVAAVNAMADTLTVEQAVSPWASEAMGDSRIQPEPLKRIITQRFGERAVVAVPGDPIANATAEANGACVIHGGALTADVWANVRKHQLIPSTSQAFPTPLPSADATAPRLCPLCKQALRT
jgi:hypothetical protein